MEDREHESLPPKGEWMVQQMAHSGTLFLMESDGDGMGHIVNLDLGEHLAPFGLDATENRLRPLLEQICTRHNETIEQ